jgi:multicomponent Na+:H+ antiporter subunit A
LDLSLTLIVASGFALAPLAPVVHRRLGSASGWLVALLPASLFACLLTQLGRVEQGQALRESLPWVPGLGIELAFALDGLSLLFALLITGIGTVIFAYAGAYFGSDPRAGRFQVVALVFMAAMLGLVLADDLILLFVFWELTSVTSYLLVGFDHAKPDARRAALQALLVTGLGGLALLAGFLMLGAAGETFRISVLLERGDLVRAHPLYLGVLSLVLLGAFTKSAQVPFHFWLPGAMAAPSPVSAYLHSATMVKAGVYLLARLSVVIGNTEAWHYVVTAVGGATLLTGAILAYPQRDLKRILAYTTVSSLGMITLLLGIETQLAVKAAVVYLLVHALFKASLFLVAGNLDHEAGSRDITLLAGLRRAMPLTAAAALLSALSMAGLPPLFGFIAKELLYEAKIGAPRGSLLVTSAGVVANVLMVAAAALVALRPFWGRRVASPRAAHEGPLGLWAGPLLLGLVGLLLGLMPDVLATRLVSGAVSAARATPTELTLKLWHGLNPVLVLSIATVALGAALYKGREALLPALRPLESLAGLGPHRAYALLLDGFVRLAAAQTRLLQSGQLGQYVRIIVVTFAGLAGYALLSRHALTSVPFAVPAPTHVALLVAIVAGAAVVARSRSRLGAVTALGVVGFGVALSFLVWSGPDLALTQFAIETLSVLLFVFVLYSLPRFQVPRRLVSRLMDAGLALAAGAVITLLVWQVTAIERASPLARYVSEASLPLGKGRNVVNVILVDVRAFDTLGEITVLAVAALGVHTLMRLRAGKESG